MLREKKTELLHFFFSRLRVLARNLLRRPFDLLAESKAANALRDPLTLHILQASFVSTTALANRTHHTSCGPSSCRDTSVRSPRSSSTARVTCSSRSPRTPPSTLGSLTMASVSAPTKATTVTVWTIDVDSTSTLLVSGSADNQMRLWEVATGKCLFVWEFTTAAKRVAFSEDCTQVLVVTEQRMGYRGSLRVFRINRDPASWTQQDPEPTRTITFSGPKAVVAAFAPCDQYIVTGHENGKVATYYHDDKEPESGIDAELEENSTDAHTETISDLQMSADRTYFVTSSRDKTAKLIDSKTLQVIKTYARDAVEQRCDPPEQAIRHRWRWSGCHERHHHLGETGSI